MGKLLLVTLGLLVIGPPEWRGHLVLAALGFGVLYVLACAVWWQAPCGVCGGNKRLMGPDERHGMPCPRCHGQGWCVRWGRRVWLAVWGGRSRV